MNDRIEAAEVRVIGPDGRQHGVMATADALRLARAQSMDLVEIVPTATPPVVRIVNYAKFCKELERRKNQAGPADHINN